MTEAETVDTTVKLANRILDRPSGDPDDDQAVLARQFLRALDEIERLNALLIGEKEKLWPGIRGLREERDALKAENARLTATLKKIGFAGSDCPPARELEAFYRSQLHYCIGTAARALTPAAGGDDV